MKSSVVSAVSLLATAVVGIHFPTLRVPLPPQDDDTFAQLYLPATANSTSAHNLTGTAFFDQLLDHDDPSKGTFQQQYWWNATNWAGPGSPVVYFTPGEIAAAPYVGYLTNATITGLFAQEIKGAVVIVEHRYYGASSPYDELTVENLQLLTVKQAVADGVYFAQNVDFAFDTNHSSNAPQAPWVFSGGSYSGALSAWTASVAPGTFWAYHSSSAPVEAIEDYWQYFSPVQEGMATNCSKDVTLVIDYVDSILLNGTADEILALKTQFGMETLEHDDDFASVLQNGPWSWQELSNYSPYSEFFTFCDAVENVEAGAAVTPGPDGVGLEKALAGYAAWINDTIAGPDACTYYGYDEYDLSCYDSYDANNTIFTDITVDNAPNRQWNWILCNEPLNYWQDGAPEGRPTIVSRLVTAEYWERQCALFFPPTDGYSYGQAEGLTVTDVNEWSQGWDITNTTRLTWTNGEFDPWRTASVSSGYRPGGALKSTAEAPVNITPQGVHCYDLILKNGVNNAGVQAVIDTEVAQMVKWVAEFYAQDY